MFPFTQYKPWMTERYGEPLFRIPVEIASSCPHGRCAFCSEDGSRAQQTQRQESPFEQAEEAIRFAKRRYKAKQFMLYIQAFTADLTDPAQQQMIFELLRRFDFTAISIGTRPDCLPEEALEFLAELKSRILTLHEVWVELGVQTAHDETLERIHRGHDWECSRQAILTLAERGIYVAPHVILGLPGEYSNDWKRTAEELAKLPISGIKIHNLHVVKGTAMADHPPPVMNHWEYAEALMEFLRRIPENIPVMRISTDTPDEQLVAPHCHLEKGQFIKTVIQQMTCRQISQGELTKSRISNFEFRISPITTEDGSITFFSRDWKEHYHTKAGARLEAQKKFVEPSGLKEKIADRELKLLDVCFGLGNNSLAALCEAGRAGKDACSKIDGKNIADRSVCSTADAATQAGRDACSTCEADTPVCHSINITALEMDKRIVRAAAEHFQPLETDPVDWNETLRKLLCGTVDVPSLGKIDLRFGDARFLVQQLKNNVFDVVFHDPFSSQHCPELWTVEFFQQLQRVMKPEGVLLTYSSAAPVRGAMFEAGFHIAETVPGHQMGNGTIASPSPLPAGLPAIGTLLYRGAPVDARRSIPYRDPWLCATSRTILRNRQNEREAAVK